MLRLAQFGEVQFARNGDELLFERFDGRAGRPADEEGIYGQHRAKLYVASRLTGWQSRPLMEQDQASGYTLGPTSPDGTIVSFIRAKGDVLRMGTVNLITGAISIVGPSVSAFGVSRPAKSLAWASNRRIVYAVGPLPPNSRLLSVYNLGSFVSAEWAKAQHGSVSTAIESDSQNLPQLLGGLVAVDVMTGKTTKLATGTFIAWNLAPDGNAAAAIEAKLIRPEPGGLLDFNRLIHTSLVLVDTKAKLGPQWILPGYDVLSDSVRWSKSGMLVSFFARKPGQNWSDGTVYLYDRRTRLASAVSYPEGMSIGEVPTSSQALWMGDNLVLALSKSKAQSDGGRVDWFRYGEGGLTNLTRAFDGTTFRVALASDRGLVISQDGVLWLVPPSGKRRKIKGAPPGLTPVLDPANQVLFGRSVVSGEPLRALFALDVTDWRMISKYRVPTAGSVMAFDERTGRIAMEAPTSNAQELDVISDDIGLHQVDQINEYLNDVAPARLFHVNYDGLSGEKLSYWLMLPASYKGKSPLPAIVEVYGGLVYQRQSNAFPDTISESNWMNAQILAGHGYAVLFPSVPREYQSLSADPGAEMTTNVLTAIDAAVDTHCVDPNRLGLIGLSNGASTALQLLTHTKIFRAAIAINGAYDPVSWYGALSLPVRYGPEIGWAQLFPQSYQESGFDPIGGPPWRNLELYTRRSPLLSTRAIQTPTMLVEGDLDYSMAAGEEMFLALYRENKEATLVKYIGEGHVLGSPANIRDFWRRSFEWFDPRVTGPADGSASDSANPPSSGHKADCSLVH